MNSKSKIEYVIKPKSRLSIDFKELAFHKELFYFFTLRDIKVKYKQTLLGFLWVVLQPIIMMSIFSVFFGRALNVPSDGVPYPIFVFSGLLLWNVFATGITNSSSSMITNANILKKIYFPRLIIPISAILVSLFDFVISFIVFCLYLGYMVYFENINISIVGALLYLPLSILLATFTTVGLGCFLSSLNVKYRDFRYIVPFLVQILLFLTPVIYPTSIIEMAWLKNLVSLNPMTASIGLLRHGILNTSLDMQEVVLGGFSSIFLFILGIFYFKKAEMYFADTV